MYTIADFEIYFNKIKPFLNDETIVDMELVISKEKLILLNLFTNPSFGQPLHADEII